MDRRKAKLSKNPSSGRKKVVKNEYYYEYKKKKIIKICIISASIVIMSGFIWSLKEVPVKAEMTINNSTIEWIPEKENLKGITFQILKDGKIIEETNKLKYVDKSQKDTGIPDDISEINTYRTIKNLKILWKEPLDKGSNNTYQIFALNKFGKKIFKSKEVEGGVVSGIDKYIIRFNGETFESEKPEFVLDCENLSNRKYTIDIKSVDKEGNESEFKTFAFDLDVIDFDFKDGKLIPKDYKYTNDDYNFYIIDKDVALSDKEIPQFDKQMFLLNKDLSSILNSGFKPTMTMPNYVLKSNEVSFSWTMPKENSKAYSFYVEAVNKQTLEKVYSDLQEINCATTISGYHYAFNNASTYVVSSTDNYTNNNFISIDSTSLAKNKKYYFHVATIDSTGAMSDTKTISVNLASSNSLENKKELIRKFIYKTKITSNEEYKNVIDTLADNFSTDDIKALSKAGITISLIKEDFLEYLTKHNITDDKTVGDCIKKNKSIYFNVNKSTNSLIRILESVIN